MALGRRALTTALVVCLSLALVFVVNAAPSSMAEPMPSLASAGSFVNTDLTRTIDLRTHLEEVTLAIKAKNTGSSSLNTYVVAIPAEKAPRLSFLEASLGKKKLISRAVRLTSSAAAPGSAFYAIDLPSAVAAGESVSLQVLLVFTRTQRPFPESILQSENQLVMYEDSTVVYSPYSSTTQETSVRLASKTVESYTPKKNAKKNGDEIKYDQFEEVAAFDSRTLAIHFVNNAPFVTFNTMSKDIEVSHWGNVAVQDNYILTHTGAKLRGPFHRFDYEQRHRSGDSPASFRTLVAELPRTARDIYYRDVIGNVSTSHVRRARDHTRVEIDPRFPMFGGWESDFHIGYNLPSQHYLQVDNNDASHYVLNISFAAPFASAAIDELAVRVILPEGASDIQWRTPFDIDTAEFTEFKTYLDTTGRPTLILRKKNCVRHHQQHFQVSYRFAKASILREPMLIAAATLLCLLLVIAFTHADLRITDDATEGGDMRAIARGSSLQTRRTGTDVGAQVQEVLEGLLAVPNGLLAAAQDRTHAETKQVLVTSLTKEVTSALKSLETTDATTFAPTVAALTTAIGHLGAASKKYVQAKAAHEIKQTREALAAIVEQIHAHAEKLANL